MVKSTRNTGKAWTREDLTQLESLARKNTPTSAIGLKLGRTEEAVGNVKRYMEVIESARLIERVEVNLSTGDVEYPGNAMEVCNEEGGDLFHIVVTSSGEKHVLFFARKDNYRLPLSKLEEILQGAKKAVKSEAEISN